MTKENMDERIKKVVNSEWDKLLSHFVWFTSEELRDKDEELMRFTMEEGEKSTYIENELIYQTFEKIAKEFQFLSKEDFLKKYI
jgi:hypothetical protein